jgi:hypothetical protein
MKSVVCLHLFSCKFVTRYCIYYEIQIKKNIVATGGEQDKTTAKEQGPSAIPSIGPGSGKCFCDLHIDEQCLFMFTVKQYLF